MTYHIPQTRYFLTLTPHPVWMGKSDTHKLWTSFLELMNESIEPAGRKAKAMYFNATLWKDDKSKGERTWLVSFPDKAHEEGSKRMEAWVNEIRPWGSHYLLTPEVSL